MRTLRNGLRLAFLAALLHAGRAAAVDVFRCVGADGATVYQDVPCNDGERQSVIHLVDDRPPPPPSQAPDEPEATQPADAAPNDAIANAPPPPPPGPSFFLCTRHDGSRYISENGIPGRTAVPYAMLSGSGQTLGEAYGGRNGIGVSAPGLRTPPTLPASANPLAGAYVWIEDECHFAQPPEACAFLRSRLDEVEYRLKRAFSDTAPQLKTERDSLRQRMRGC